MKGIILAGGTGSRLFPNTIAVSKQLLPIYDKPLIYYPLSTLLLANITEILVISTPEDIPNYKKLLGDGSWLGISICYAIQEEPNGLAEAFIIGEDFIGDDSVCLILGDNVFYGQSFSTLLKRTRNQAEQSGAAIFGYQVKDPSSYGVVEFNEDYQVIDIKEKPKHPKSNYAVPGLYFYNNDVVQIAKNVQPSARGEKEITSVNREYLKQGKLRVTVMGRGMMWMDTGTPKNMYKASSLVKNVQEVQGYYISAPEEIAWQRHFIDDEQLRALAIKIDSTDYGKYLLSLLSNQE
ncbi:MAG: glucose-1-phosphate thymidylyltransferase RfbA [Lachnospiraceae bacterium]|nr:glucose-1-phosphate thymidylyltransferase RfbA [Lachnospiraceae bacterium]